jgi:hypothetical protein
MSRLEQNQRVQFILWQSGCPIRAAEFLGGFEGVLRCLVALQQPVGDRRDGGDQFDCVLG